VTRRAALALVASCLATGCGSLKSPVSQAPPPLPVYVPNLSPGSASVASLQKFAPSLDPIGSGTRYQYLARAREAPRWVIVEQDYFRPPLPFVSLAPAVRQHNLFVPGLLQSTLAAFQQAGTQWALPTSVAPLGVLYRPDLFAQAGVASPTADWTIDDLSSTCRQLALAVQKGALPSAVHPLQGWFHSFGSIPLSFDYAHTWTLAAFISGYGGTCVKDGAFAFADADALQGAAAFVDLWRSYGTRTADGSNVATNPPNVAMYVAMYDGPDDSYDSSWRWARFPKFPAGAPVPARLLGAYLATETSAGDILNSVPQTPPVPLTALDAVVEFALWRYGAGGAYPEPPVLAAQSIQSAYWTSGDRQSSGAVQVGDWSHYFYPCLGWPLTVVSWDDVIFTAIQAALADPGSLADALGAAQATLNASAAQYAAEVGSAPPSPPGSFPTNGPSTAAVSGGR